MDLKEIADCDLEDLSLPAAKKICLDNNDVSNTSRDNSSLSDGILNLGDLFSHRKSLGSCSINDRVDNSSFSPPIHRNQISDENKRSIEDGDKVLNITSLETDDNSGVTAVLSDLNNEYECDKNDETCSNLSKRAFNINESIGFMDETCLDESHSDDTSKGNLLSVEVKSPSYEKSLRINDSESILNRVNKNCNDLMKISDNDSSNKLEVTLDYTCKQEIMGEGTLDLCHSTIKKDAMSPSPKLFVDTSLTSMSIDESLVNDLNNIPCQLLQDPSSDLVLKRPSMEGFSFEDSYREQLCNNSNSTNLFNEVSGCALDYTCSKSLGNGVNETITGTPLSNRASGTSIDTVLECPNIEQQDTNRSSSIITVCNDPLTKDNMNVQYKDDLKSKENSVPDPENPINDLYDLSDLKNSFMSNKTFSTEEVNFLKENLLKVMELLKNDNNSFESFKLASENEKRELLEKIKYLESILARDHESCADILTFQNPGLEGKINQCEDFHVLGEELSQTNSQYQNLLQLVLVTKANWLDNKLFVDFLSDLNVAHNELFIPIIADNNKYIINHEKVYDLMLSLSKEIFKTNLFKQECNNILKTYHEIFNKDKDRTCFIANEYEENLLGNLKTTFEEILGFKNCLEKENAELKAVVCSKSDEIKILSSAIENLNQQLNIVMENKVISTDPIDSNDHINVTTHNLSRQVTENLIIHDCLNESNTNISVNKDSLETLKQDSSLSEENYNNACLKCLNYELELQKMREVEQTYQGLLIHHNVLKTEVDSKSCEIEKLNEANRSLIEQIDYLMCQNKSRETGGDESQRKVKFEAVQKSFVEHEKVLVSKVHTSNDFSFENAEMVENIKNELNTSTNNLSLKEGFVKLPKIGESLDASFHCSKDDVLKSQFDFNSLNQRYSELLSDFELYKKTYTHTGDDYKVWDEEKKYLECELDSLKSQLAESAVEPSKMKCDNEEINNQIKNLMAQILDLETSNANLKTQLDGMHSDSDHYINQLNHEMSELKIKLDSTEILLTVHEKKYEELKISYDKVCEDLESKTSALLSLSESKEKWEKQLETFIENDTLLKQNVEELKRDRDCLENKLLSSQDEISKLQMDLNSLNEKHDEIHSSFDLYKEKYTFSEDEYIAWKEEKQALEIELDSLKSQLESAQEESSKLKHYNEEINNNLQIIENQLSEEKQSSKDIQDSYDIMKTKYEESVDEINNKAEELRNLRAQVSDLETTNENLKIELTNFFNNADIKADLLNNEISELKIKLDSTETLLTVHEKKYEELKISYEKVCEDLESKTSALLSLSECNENLEKQLETFNQNDTLLKQKIEELQKDRDGLTTQFHSSNDECSKLQFDLDCLKEKYSEMLSDLCLCKETNTRTESECVVLKEEKQSLECELDSLKSKLKCALEEVQKLKSDYEENNKIITEFETQLLDEKKNFQDIQSLYENLKIKYEESGTVIDNKMVEIKNLLGQLSDLEIINVNLKSELNVIRSDSEHNLDVLNKQVCELKEKCEVSDKLLVDLEEKHSALKISYNQICEDLESKNAEISFLSSCKEQLEKETDSLRQNNLLLQQKLTDLEINEELHKKTILDLNIQFDSVNKKVECMKNIEMQMGTLKDEYDILSLYHPQKEVYGEQPCLFSEFFNTVEAIIKDFISFKEKSLEKEMKLSSSEEEVSRLNILLESLKEEIKLKVEESVKLQENYSSLSKQYNSLMDSSRDSNIRCNTLLEKLKELETQNSLCKSTIQGLKSDIIAKESTIASLSSIKELHESTMKENEALSSRLKEKIEEYETLLDKVKNSEDKYLNLKLEHDTLTNEINALRNKNETLEMKYNENYALYMNSKSNIEVLQKEREELRKNFIKCEKDYQNSLDLVKKCQDNMGNLDKQYNLSIAKLNVILKEKESYESQSLSLQKINDELMNRIKELNCKCQENQNMLIKFKELEKSYEKVSSKHQCLENQLIDYENLKRENEVLKSRVSEKESFSNNLSINYNVLNEKYNSLSDELKTLSSAVLTLVPGENSAMEKIKLIGEKLLAMKKIENDLEEEKMKCENLDEECNLLNEDLKYKDVVIGDMYKDHSSKMNELKDLLKKEENLRQEILLENSILKDKIKCLDSEICKLKTIEKSACSSCAELKDVLQKLKMDLVDNSSKVTTLQLQIEEKEIQNKNKIQDYRKKISSLQEELGAALNKLEDNRLKNEIVCLNASVQTESLPVQISGQSGIVQSFKIKEQEEKIKKFEKENLVLKRMCQSRLQTIQELKTKLENVSKPQKNQRNVLEEVQNHHSS